MAISQQPPIKKYIEKLFIVTKIVTIFLATNFLRGKTKKGKSVSQQPSQQISNLNVKYLVLTLCFVEVKKLCS